MSDDERTPEPGLQNLPGPWRWEQRDGGKWWRVNDQHGIEDGPHDDADDCPPVRVLTGDREAILGLLEDTADHYAHHGQHAGGLSDAERARFDGRAEGIAEAAEVLADWRLIEPRDLLAAFAIMLGGAEPADADLVIIPRPVVPAFAAELYERAEAHAADHPFPEDVDDVTEAIKAGDVPGWELWCPACHRVGGQHDDGCEGIAIPRQTGEARPDPDRPERAHHHGESVPPEDDTS